VAVGRRAQEERKGREEGPEKTGKGRGKRTNWMNCRMWSRLLSNASGPLNKTRVAPRTESFPASPTTREVSW